MKRLALPTFAMVSVSIVVATLGQQGRRHTGRIMQWFRRGLPLAVEVIMLLGAARLAYTMLTNQAYFERFPGPYEWLMGHGVPYSDEWFWGAIAATSTMLKSIGICLCVCYRRDPTMLDLGYGMRLIGWLASAMLWGAFTISLTIWEPLAYTSIASSCAFGLALWGLCMGPAMPDDIRG